MVKLVEVIQTFKNEYKFREIFINPAHVVYLREDGNMKMKLDEGTDNFPAGFDIRQSFTRIQVHNGTTGSEFVVVGPPHLIENKLKGDAKELLRG